MASILVYFGSWYHILYDAIISSVGSDIFSSVRSSSGYHGLLHITHQCPARVGFGQSRSEKWRKNVIHSFREVQVKKKWLEIEIEKWKWNENDWKSRSRSESEMKKLRDRDREVKFLENFREFKKDRFWSIGKGAFGGYIISLCNLLMLTI